MVRNAFRHAFGTPHWRKDENIREYSWRKENHKAAIEGYKEYLSQYTLNSVPGTLTLTRLSGPKPITLVSVIQMSICTQAKWHRCRQVGLFCQRLIHTWLSYLMIEMSICKQVKWHRCRRCYRDNNFVGKWRSSYFRIVGR